MYRCCNVWMIIVLKFTLNEKPRNLEALHKYIIYYCRAIKIGEKYLTTVKISSMI